MAFVHARAIAAAHGAVANLAAAPSMGEGTLMATTSGVLIGLVCSAHRITDLVLAESGYNICALGIENIEKLVSLCVEPLAHRRSLHASAHRSCAYVLARVLRVSPHHRYLLPYAIYLNTRLAHSHTHVRANTHAKHSHNARLVR